MSARSAPPHNNADLLSMSFVIIRGERFALDYGRTTLGGRGADSLAAEAIADLPPFAVIDYPIDGPSTVRALPDVHVTLNGQPLAAEPRRISHGDRLEVGDVLVAIGDMRMSARTRHAGAVTEEHALSALLGESTPTAASGGRIMRVADGSVFAVPAHGLTIGRDPDAGVVLASRNVSRLHAEISPSLLGYMLTDRSSNGVWVNGVRVEGSILLGQHDVIRIGAEEFRFEADLASFAPGVRPVEEAPLANTSALERQPRPSRLLASLEVLSEGPLKGTRFRLERSTVQLGRGARNDVQLANESVSSSHASLVQTGSSWTILDLGSRNGTFVEGEVVHQQRELPDVCEIQLGALKLLFRAINAAESDSIGTVGVFNVSGRLPSGA